MPVVSQPAPARGDFIGTVRCGHPARQSRRTGAAALALWPGLSAASSSTGLDSPSRQGSDSTTDAGGAEANAGDGGLARSAGQPRGEQHGGNGKVRP